MSIDYDVTLSGQVAKSNMATVAKEIGVTKDAVRQMLLNDRDIYLKLINGQMHYAEFRTWRQGPAKRQSTAA